MGTDLSEGQPFGEYQLLEVAGTGGMGVVYRAEQRSLGRVVALKVIRPEIAQSGDYRSRFLREARLAAAVDHPHVVSVFGVGEYAGRLYLAMQWIDGLELRTILDRQQRLDPERAVRIGTQLAMALDAVHKAGLLHRDVKPANVLVRNIAGQDHAYLADFGIAKMPQAEGDLTRTGLVIGTPGYLSPEQMQGHKADSRSDLYALGCIVFEALTGHRPFDDAHDQALGWAHVSSPRPVASAICPALGPRYDAFLSRALALDPRDRPQSGHEFAEALHSAHTQRPDTRTHIPTVAVRPSDEPEPTMTRSMSPRPDTPTPRMADTSAGVPSRVTPSSALPRPSPSRAHAPTRGWARKLTTLACCAVFLASVTLLTSYYRDPGGKSLLQATNGDPNSPLYPQDFWIPIGLVALVLIFTVISLGVPGRSLMVCATAAALGLVGYTLYLPTKGAAPGFGPYGSSYWLSLAAAAVMAIGAAAAASARRGRT